MTNVELGNALSTMRNRLHELDVLTEILSDVCGAVDSWWHSCTIPTHGADNPPHTLEGNQ